MLGAMRWRTATVLLVLATAGSCRSAGFGSRTASVCPPEQRTALLSEALRDRVPTLSGATLAVIADGASPRLRTLDNGTVESDDPHVEVRKPGRWVPLKVAPGSYRIYWFSPGGGPTIAVVSCPA